MKNKNKYSVLIVAILSLTGCWTRQGETVSGTVPLTLTDSLRKLVTVDTVQIRERTSELLLNGKVAFDQDRLRLFRCLLPVLSKRSSLNWAIMFAREKRLL